MGKYVNERDFRVRCRIHTNTTCLKCGKVEKEMMVVGAFIMCLECWEKEFGAVESIDVNSPLYKKKYKKWLKTYLDSVDV